MKKIALSERNKDIIKNYLVGGAALGGSTALMTSLINYINSLKSQVKKKEDTSADDETLYVNIDKAAGVTEDALAGGAAMTGGALTALGSYALVRKLYQKIKRQQLQEELDKAQQSFLESAKEEAKVKNAADEGRPLSVGETVLSLPVAISLLSALAAGAITNKGLEKTFPAAKKPKSLAPKKVVIRRTPKELENEEEKAAYDKSAATHEDDALEFLMHLCMGSKSAAQSELVDIVHAVAQGRGEEFKTSMLEYGFDHAMDTIKGASETPITAEQKQFAIGYCVKNAALNPVVSMLAAVEYNDMAPRFTKLASLQTEEAVETLVKIAGVLGAMNRIDLLSNSKTEIVTTKEALDVSLDSILDLMNKNKEENAEEDDIEQNEDLNAEDSIDSNEEKKVNDRKPLATNKIAPEIINELDEQDDIIDQAMSTPVTPAKAVAVESKHK